MMGVFSAYIEGLKALNGEDHANTVKHNAMRVASDCLSSYDYTAHRSAILLGHVQSGKTGTLIGLLANAIDDGFKFLIVLTSDNVLLYTQTLERFSSQLTGIDVYGEKDDDKFIKNSLRYPCVVVLKKNHSILRNWLKKLSHVSACPGEPLILVDDEADAASLNTLVNKSDISTINGLIRGILDIPPSSLYVQTTATPFGNLLLNSLSTTKPTIITRFAPPKEYMGGEFFYGEDSSSYEIIPDSDSKLVLSRNADAKPQGLHKAVCYFIGHVIHQIENNVDQDNFLVHPSHKVADHKTTSEKISGFLKDLRREVYSGNKLTQHIIPSMTGMSLHSLDDIGNAIDLIDIQVVNSETELPNFSNGFHIIVGGNCLGRGLTIPQLNVCYYTRTSKTPQADTLLQHSRVFGYDRDRDHAKVFLTRSMLLTFRGISKAVDILHEHVDKGDIGSIKMLLPKDISPTRRNVIDKTTYVSLTGGVNYFIQTSSPSCTATMDSYIKGKDNAFSSGISVVTEILDRFKSDDDLLDQLKHASGLLHGSQYSDSEIYIRKDRSISKGTGTLLSPDDRLLSKKNPSKTSCFLYRLNGEVEKGWDGNPLWLINIRFPSNCIFIGADDI